MDLKQLCEINAPSGDEKRLRKILLDAAAPLCDSVRIDRMGNLLCEKKGTKPGLPRVMVSAHMDEVGFIITGATEDGLLRFRPVGGIDPRVAVSKRVYVGEELLPGVIGAMAIHLQTKAERERVLDFDNLYIDIGAKDKKEAENRAPLATYAYFAAPYIEFGDNFICAKALDDRVGCLNLLRLMEDRYPCDITFAFVTQEEVGLRGAMGAGFTVQPDLGVVLEGTSANDLGDVDEQLSVCNCGEGVAVSFMDNASIADRGLYRSMLSIGTDTGIPHQVKRGISGGNDAGAIQRAGEGVRTVVLSVPCRYIHGPSSVAMRSDIDAQYRLCKAFLENADK